MAKRSDTYGPKATPTTPKQAAVRADDDDRWEGEDTQQACPLCLRSGYVSPEVALAFEAFCASLRVDR